MKSYHFFFLLYYLEFLYNMYFFIIINNSEVIFILEEYEKNMPTAFVNRVNAISPARGRKLGYSVGPQWYLSSIQTHPFSLGGCVLHIPRLCLKGSMPG